MSQPFYRAFEDRHRGSRELIKSRQQIYLPFIQPLKDLYPECSALDLGCGRGEWLEVLLENGFRARGVDLDEGMLEGCSALKLPVEQGEALAILTGMADESLTVISGFHIAEHLTFADLQRLVTEALRALKPAGLLILETPNVENLVVGTSDFYLDPTHVRPIPHQLLSFLTEHTGFTRSKILRLQESPQLIDSELGLINVLTGASPDYAVVAQKNSLDHELSLFNQAFEKEYGLALHALAQKYDQSLHSNFSELAEQQLTKLQAQNDRTESLIKSVSDRFQQQLQDIELQMRQMEERLQAAHEAKLNEIFSRSSRRYTWPLRASKRAIVWLLRSSGHNLRLMIRRTAITLATILIKRPALHNSIAALLKLSPRIFAHLRQFALHHQIIHAPETDIYHSTGLSNFANADLNLLTPRAREIYSDLKRAIADKKEF